MNNKLFKIFLSGLCLMSFANVQADLFLVKTAPGPGFTSPQHELEVLEKGIIPTFEMLKNNKNVLFSAFPVGSRIFTLIVEADSNSDVDKLLRALPAWGVMDWKVVALESLEGRLATEKKVVENLKKMK